MVVKKTVKLLWLSSSVQYCLTKKQLPKFAFKKYWGPCPLFLSNHFVCMVSLFLDVFIKKFLSNISFTILLILLP